MDLDEFKALCAEYKDCDGSMRCLLEATWIVSYKGRLLHLYMTVLTTLL